MGRHGNTFCPRRAAKNGNCNTFCPRRAAATATPFVHGLGRGGPRRAVNGNGNTFCPRVGPRRAAENGNGNTFCPRRAAEGRGERQRQHLLSTGARGPRRAAGPLRTATATSFCPRRATKGITTKNGNGNTLLSTKGHEGPRRTATATPFCPRRANEGPRRTATATPFVHDRATRGRGELPFDPRSARGEWRGVRRERTLGPSQSGGAGTVAGALRFLVAG